MANPQHKTCLSVLRSVIGSAAGNEARFAEKIGRSTSWLKKASCGQIPLTENIALRISHETGISMRWLMQRDTSKTPVDKDDKTFTKATYENYRSPDYFPGKGCDCEARSSYECGCEGADWTPKEVYDLRGEVMALKAFAESTAHLAKSLKAERDEARAGWDQEITFNQCQLKDAKQLADRLTALELHSTSELARLEQERDEARNALMKIKALFIYGTDIYADRENMGMIAKNALEETK